MASAHQTALTHAVEDILIESPEMGAMLANTRRSIRNGAYDRTVVEFATSGRMSLEDMYVFSMIWGWHNTGQLYMATIPVGKKPHADSCLSGNKKSLSNLTDDFSANVWCGKSDCDGVLKWNSHIGLTSFTESGVGTCECGCGKSKYTSKVKTFPPGEAPLEIGDSLSSRVYMHLFQSRCLARWMFGREDIVIAVLDKPRKDFP